MEQVQFSGVQIGSLQWKLHPLKLLTGSLSADIEIKNNEQYLVSMVEVSLHRKVNLKDTRFNIDLALFQPLIYGMPFAYAGQAAGDFPFFSFKKNESIYLDGKLTLSAIKLISPQQQAFGDFIANFNSKDGKSILAIINDSNAALKLNGNIALNYSGQLEVAAQLAARNQEDSIDNMLAFLGAADGKGERQFKTRLVLWH